jgi:hypothetical protein
VTVTDGSDGWHGDVDAPLVRLEEVRIMGGIGNFESRPKKYLLPWNGRPVSI